MDFDTLRALLFLLSFHFFAFLVFASYVFCMIGFAKRSEKLIYGADVAIWFAPYLGWGAGFLLSAQYGHEFGLGKSLGNLFEPFWIGILTFVYVIARILYVEWLKLRWGKAFISYLLRGILLPAFFIGLLCPSLPE